jgi:hypothetical protein
MKGFTMKKFICFAAPLVLALGVLASGGTSVFAAGPPGSPPGQEPCSHGNNGADCPPDPSTNGKDCDAHGNDGIGGENEDHCLGETPTTETTATTPTTVITPTTPTTPTSATTADSTAETPSTPTTPTTSGDAAPAGTSTPPAAASDARTGDIAGTQVTKKAQPKHAKPRQHTKPKAGSVLAAATVKAPSVLPFTP